MDSRIRQLIVRWLDRIFYEYGGWLLAGFFVAWMLFSTTGM